MIVCDNCGKPVGDNFIRIRPEGIYLKAARKAGLTANPDLCSIECVIDYCTKIPKPKKKESQTQRG